MQLLLFPECLTGKCVSQNICSTAKLAERQGTGHWLCQSSWLYRPNHKSHSVSFGIWLQRLNLSVCLENLIVNYRKRRKKNCTDLEACCSPLRNRFQHHKLFINALSQGMEWKWLKYGMCSVNWQYLLSLENTLKIHRGSKDNNEVCSVKLNLWTQCKLSDHIWIVKRPFGESVSVPVKDIAKGFKMF